MLFQKKASQLRRKRRFQEIISFVTRCTASLSPLKILKDFRFSFEKTCIFSKTKKFVRFEKSFQLHSTATLL